MYTALCVGVITNYGIITLFMYSMFYWNKTEKKNKEENNENNNK